MAEAFRVRLLGFAELRAGSATLFARIGEQAPQQFERVGERVARQVRGRVPRLTGRLASSATATLSGDTASVRLGENIRYAQFVEYGGRGHPHSPQGNYLYPTAIDAEPLLVAAGERVAETEIGGMRWPRPR